MGSFGRGQSTNCVCVCVYVCVCVCVCVCVPQVDNHNWIAKRNGIVFSLPIQLAIWDRAPGEPEEYSAPMSKETPLVDGNVTTLTLDESFPSRTELHVASRLARSLRQLHWVSLGLRPEPFPTQ